MTHRFFQKLRQIFSDVQLNNDLNQISKWAFQWKMLSNSDRSKQAIFLVNMAMKITPHYSSITQRYKSLLFRNIKDLFEIPNLILMNI